MLSGDLLLAADSRHATEIADRGRWFIARRTSTGTVVFRVGLPLNDDSPKPIRDIGGLIMVPTDVQPDGKFDVVLVDRKGEVRYRFYYQVVDGLQYEDDYVFLTDRNICRCASQDKIVWTVAFLDPMPQGGGGLLRLANGDLMGFLFSGVDDSGVDVVRLDPTTGNVAWQVHCKALGVRFHKEYDHRATVTVEGNQVRVMSQGSAGTFVELLALATGKQLKRNDRWNEGWE